MPHVAGQELQHLLSLYGYWAVIVLVSLESLGIPVPGETMLIAAAIYAGSTHRLSIVLVVGAAALGGILGDNAGYWIGREGGYRLLRRFGGTLHLSEARLKLGQYLFRRHGGKVVFLGRFVALLRALAAFLAGANRMAWRRFLFFNASGAVVWASFYGAAAYFFGEEVHRLSGTLGKVLVGIAVVVVIGFLVVLKRNAATLEEEAERAMPGPLDGKRPKKASSQQADQRSRTSSSC